MYSAVKIPQSSRDGGGFMCCHLIRHFRQPARCTSQRWPSPAWHGELLTAPLTSKGSSMTRGRNPCWARWWSWTRFWTHNFASAVSACLMKDIDSAHKTCWVTSALLSVTIHCTLLLSSCNNTEIPFWGACSRMPGWRRQSRKNIKT